MIFQYVEDSKISKNLKSIKYVLFTAEKNLSSYSFFFLPSIFAYTKTRIHI